jgi:hypothetical protein
MRSRAGWLLLCALGAMAGSAHAAVTFQFRNNTDGPGEGLNDTTPFLPEGGNTATTLGEARLKVLEEAGRVWGSLLNSSVPIVVDARVDPLTCGSGGITLATAGPATAYRNPSGPQPDVFFPSALADSLAGTDIAATSGTADIRVTINLSLHNNLNCANGARFYYGFDHNHGAMPDLLEVLLHELGHGLGFSSFVDLTTGNGIIQSGVERFGSYDQYIFDEAANQSWTSMTAQQRLQAAARSGFLGWTGTNANNSRLRYTSGVTAGGRLMLYAPTTISTGSSVSHWDITLTPSALMEPFIINATNNFTDLVGGRPLFRRAQCRTHRAEPDHHNTRGHALQHHSGWLRRGWRCADFRNHRPGDPWWPVGGVDHAADLHPVYAEPECQWPGLIHLHRVGRQRDFGGGYGDDQHHRRE